jgi:hypothetical protein
MLNKREINWLIKKYETITKEQIETASNKKLPKGLPYYFYRTVGEKSMVHLTGFSNSEKCKPCSKVNHNCSYCGLQIDFNRCYEQKTYKAIENAETVNATFKAIRARAEFLRKYFPNK